MKETEREDQPGSRQWLGFWAMIVQQTQNAFNDKMAQFILIPLAAAVGYSMESVAGLLIAMPFVLFAPLAGWFSDRFSKRDVLMGSAVLQLLVLGWIFGAVKLHALGLAMVGFFFLAVQSAFFSPAKMGLNKELLGSKWLGFATGIQQMLAMLAMMIGQVTAAWWFDHRNQSLGGGAETAWTAASFPVMILWVGSVLAVLMSLLVPRVPAQGNQAFSGKMLYSHFMGLKDLWSDGSLRKVSFGVAYFWGFAACLNLWTIKMARVLTEGGTGFGTISALFMVCASAGMALGFGFAAFLLRKRIELGWVPLAGLLMTVLSGLMLTVLPDSALDLLQLEGMGLLQFVKAAPEEVMFLVVLVVLAFVSALFLAPLNAWLQDHYPSGKRGEMQSAVNLQDCLAGALAIVTMMVADVVVKRLGGSGMDALRVQLVILSLTAMVATVLVLRVLPADMLRLVDRSLMRMIYRFRVAGVDRMPAKGGVLLLPNHVTFIDAFLLSAASPRPVRFVMDEAFTAHKAIAVFTKIFDTVNIRRDQPLEAIREVIRALKAGDVICLFPEGQLTRTGALCPLQRGFELILKKAGHPVIPVWVDGSWGSVHSFEGGKYFFKRPRRLVTGVNVAFGEVIDSKEADMVRVQEGLLAASGVAVGLRYQRAWWGLRKPVRKSALAAKVAAMTGAERRRVWVNGHQVGMLAALARRGVVHVWEGDADVSGLLGLLVAFPELYGGQVAWHAAYDGTPGTWVGCDATRQHLLDCKAGHEGVVFYDFGGEWGGAELAGVERYECLAVEGQVVAMSLAHPPASTDDVPVQHGWRQGTWGRILPGWSVKHGTDGEVRVHGPAADDAGLLLPTGAWLDRDGFLWKSEKK